MKLSKMNEKEKFKILTRIFDKKELDSIQQHIVYEDQNGYVLYNEYRVTEQKNTIKISKFKTFTVKNFNNLRNAIMWCTLDKSNKIEQAKDIEYLDVQLASSKAHIEVQNNILAKAKDNEIISLAVVKIREEILKRDTIIDRLDDFALMTKRLQDFQYKLVSK